MLRNTSYKALKFNSESKLMQRIKSKKGFTLTELIIVIAIIGILAGILSIQMMSVVNDASTTVCMTNMNQVKQTYAGQSALKGFAVTDSEALLQKTLSTFNGAIKYLEAGKYLSPCKGTCTVTYTDDNSVIVDIECSKHGKLSLMGGKQDKRTPIEKAEAAAQTLINNPDIAEAFGRYVENKIGANKTGSMDSTGVNFAPEINTYLSALGFNSEETGWRIWYDGRGELRYEVYWTDVNLNTVPVGEKVRYIKYVYNCETKVMSEPVSGKCIVQEYETADAAGQKYMINKLVPGDTHNTTIDAEYGDSWK